MGVKNRQPLKDLFLEGSIPFASDFEDIIDSAINLGEDGVKKTTTTGLEIQMGTANREAILFYDNFELPGTNPGDAPISQTAKWKISLNGEIAGTPPIPAGLSIGDGTMDSFFIQESTGNVGINTNNPSTQLEVDGGIIGSDFSIDGQIKVGSNLTNPTAKLEIDTSILMKAGSNGTFTFDTAATPASDTILLATFDGIANSPQLRFQVSDDGAGNAIADEFFDIGQDANKDFVIKSASTPVLILSQEGNVEIGSGTPGITLDVNGSIELSNTGITLPMGLKTEVDGTSQILKFDVNLDQTTPDTTSIGASFHIDSDDGGKLFKWLRRSGDPSTVLSTDELMILKSDGTLELGGIDLLAEIRRMEERILRKPTIGDLFEGGIIFEITEDATGFHGKVVGLEDLDFPSVDQLQTDAITNVTALSLIVNGTTYSDWILPAATELLQIASTPAVTSKTTFLTEIYMSSNPVANGTISAVNFATSAIEEIAPTATGKVRPIRSF